MIKDKWIIKFRNQLSALCGECNSCAAIEGSRLTKVERKDLIKILEEAIEYIDSRLFK